MQVKIDSYYPDRPIFIFGYSQLVRGVSYRSRRRVPSHFVLLYKSGMPLCRLVQAAGRAMGEQYKQLRENGFDHVVMLTQPRDYDALCAYPEFLKAIKRKMESGASLADALGATAHDSSYADVMASKKSIGALKLSLDSFVQSTLSFKPSEQASGPGQIAIDRELGTEGRGARRAILEVLLECNCLDEESALSGKDVKEELACGAYDEFFGDDETKGFSPTQMDLEAKAVTAILKELCNKPNHREAVLESNGCSGKNLKFFVFSIRLPQKRNPELC